MSRNFSPYVLVFIGILSLPGSEGIAQIMYNNGGTIHVMPPSPGNDPTILHLNGGFVNNDALGFTGSMINDGDMTITLNSPDIGDLAGSVHLQGNSIMSGNGRYYVEQNWINDARFNAQSSEVILFGYFQQFIMGSKVTTFNKLTLTGTGDYVNSFKTMMLDARISTTGVLSLNDRELQTQQYKMYVDNPDPTCINKGQIVTGGFVSSAYSGELVRATNSTESYIFPTGSSGGTPRYRPVEIKPADNLNSSFGVRFVNNDADSDNLPTTANAIPGVTDNYNHQFYHTITRGNESESAADIDIYYDETADGSFSGIHFWDDFQQGWRDALGVNRGPNKHFFFVSNRRASWPFSRSLDKHFILVNEGSGLSDVIPNIFTPNGDGINDVFHIENKNIKEFKFQVFNRWGVLLFESNSANIDWDGKTLAGAEVPDGNYFYIVNATWADDKNTEAKGFLMLSR